MALSTTEPLVDDEHAYFRPDPSEVSGVPNNDKPYHRSPCPALNTLANHGYLPRDGKNLTPEMVKKAAMEVFNLGDSIAQALVDQLPPKLTLADLGKHNRIEHDASLVHQDLHFGQDPDHVDSALVEGLIERAGSDGFISVEELASWRHKREEDCEETNPDYKLSVTHEVTTYAEAAALLLAMGDYESEKISVAHARSFLLEERIPDDFETSKLVVTGTHALYVAAKLKAMSLFSWLQG